MVDASVIENIVALNLYSDFKNDKVFLPFDEYHQTIRIVTVIITATVTTTVNDVYLTLFIDSNAFIAPAFIASEFILLVTDCIFATIAVFRTVSIYIIPTK